MGDDRTARAEARADAKAAEARAKAMRPWFKKKRFMIPLALVVVGGIAAAAGGGGDDGGSKDDGDTASEAGDNPNSSEANLWDRPDEKDGDKEREIGGAADLSGYTATVTSAARQQSLNDFEDDGYLVAQVTVVNRDSGAQPYNTFDWKLITPNGQIIDPCICANPDDLGSGDLAGGGSTDGTVAFEIGEAPGDYYLVYDPDFASSNRGVWKVIV